MDYSVIKGLHITAALLSIGLFLWRASVAIGHQRKPGNALRIVSHSVDTVLFVLGSLMAYWLVLSPLATPWFGFKLVAILVYIALGFVVMRAQRPAVKAMALSAALVVVVTILLLAHYKDRFVSVFF
jgi:uncharacterized membrane protein SirB2